MPSITVITMHAARTISPAAITVAAGVPAEETAREMGLKVRTVRSAYAALRHVSLPLRAPEGTIGARLSPEELVAMERVVTSRADP